MDLRVIYVEKFIAQKMAAYHGTNATIVLLRKKRRLSTVMCVHSHLDDRTTFERICEPSTRFHISQMDGINEERLLKTQRLLY